MKRSTILCASVAAALVLSADAAFATVNYNSSKSNTGSFTFEPKVDLNGPKLCSDAGGTIKSGPGTLSTCVVPERAAPASTPAKSK